MGLIWGIVISALGLIGAILIPVVTRLISEDAREWLPWITRGLIERAVNRLPESERERFEEEWRSHVNEMPGDFAKIYVAWGYLSASKSIGKIVGTSKSPIDAKGFPEAARRSADIALALILLLYFIPVFVIVPLYITLESPGPVFIRQKRRGANGRPFYLLKFRTTSLQPLDPMHSRYYAKETRVGRLLRSTSLDELPQLINVLGGDMTLIGPRPLSPRDR